MDSAVISARIIHFQEWKAEEEEEHKNDREQNRSEKKEEEEEEEERAEKNCFHFQRRITRWPSPQCSVFKSDLPTLIDADAAFNKPDSSIQLQHSSSQMVDIRGCVR